MGVGEGWQGSGSRRRVAGEWEGWQGSGSREGWQGSESRRRVAGVKGGRGVGVEGWQVEKGGRGVGVGEGWQE